MFLFADEGAMAEASPLDLAWVTGKREEVRLAD
jgi:hypothetical protein